MLLENGSSSLTRKAAAQQLGDVQRMHPHELYNLLDRVSGGDQPTFDVRRGCGVFRRLGLGSDMCCLVLFCILHLDFISFCASINKHLVTMLFKSFKPITVDIFVCFD